MVEDGRVTGVCFTKYRQTLTGRVQNDPRPMDNQECLQGIEAGIPHLHSLGFVHNGVNVKNIMFLDDDVLIIIDATLAGKRDKITG